MKANTVLKKLGLIAENCNDLMIKTSSQEFNVGTLMEEYAKSVIRLEQEKKSINLVLAHQATKVAGGSANAFSFQSEIGSDLITLRFSGWSRITDEAINTLQEGCKYPIVEDCYESDDGDDDEGKPITRRRWSYQILIDNTDI